MENNFTQNGITFTNVKDAGEITASSPLGFGIKQNDNIAEDGGVINAVEIDWNGAKIDENTIINTTGDLISYIKGAYSSGGSSLNFTDDEISALKAKENEQDKYIQKLEERIKSLENALKTSNTDSALLNVAAIKADADKVSNLSITSEKLINLINKASNVDLVSTSTYPNNLLLITVKKASDTSSLETTKNVVGGLIMSSQGSTLNGVVNIENALSKKLDKSAISYDSTNNTLTITNNG